MIKLFAKAMILLLIITISSGCEQQLSVFPVVVKASSNNVNDNTDLLIIDVVNIEAKVQNRFVPLEDLISEAVSPEFQENPLPQLVNKTALRINASYSTVIGRPESLVIHHFAVDVYRVISGEKHTLNSTAYISLYYVPENPRLNLVEFILEPNSTKSEATILHSLELPTFDVYKFVFRVQYHINGGDETPVTSFYRQNITFELIKSYPTPPYVIIYIFVGVLSIFLALVVFGLYGDRKYRQTAQ